jgi:hypothetical protein
VWLQNAQAATSSFAPNSFWNRTIPTYTSLDSHSDTINRDIIRQVNQYGTALDTLRTASPVYVVEQNYPLISITPWDCGGGALNGLAVQWQSVPLPPYAVPGGDRMSMVVYQPSTATVWEFSNMRQVSGQWQACGGGRISTVTDGVFKHPSV